MKKRIIIVSAFFALFLVASSFYMGVFQKMEVYEAKMGPYTIAYVEHIGSYSDVAKPRIELESKMLEAGLNESKNGIGIYYGDPKTTPADELKSDIGLVISGEDMKKVESGRDKLNFKILEEADYYVTEFPIRNLLSYSLGATKAYPAFTKYFNDKGLKVESSGIEIYDMDKKKIYFLMRAGSSPINKDSGEKDSSQALLFLIEERADGNVYENNRYGMKFIVPKEFGKPKDYRNDSLDIDQAIFGGPGNFFISFMDKEKAMNYLGNEMHQESTIKELNGNTFFAVKHATGVDIESLSYYYFGESFVAEFNIDITDKTVVDRFEKIFYNFSVSGETGSEYRQFVSKNGKFVFSHRSDWACNDRNEYNIDCYPIKRQAEIVSDGIVYSPELLVHFYGCGEARVGDAYDGPIKEKKDGVGTLYHFKRSIGGCFATITSVDENVNSNNKLDSIIYNESK